MRIAIGSDESTALTASLVAALKDRGIETTLCGALHPTDDHDWPLASAQVARLVSEGVVDGGIVCCWTGTGASIAANKVRGVRAALCADAETARGARRWNDANVLALSLRATSEPVAHEILEAWLSTEPDANAWNLNQLARLHELDSTSES